MHTNIHRIGSRIDGLLAALWQAGGTDLLLTVGLPPMLRVDGTLTPAPGTSALTAEDTDALLAEVLTPEQADGLGQPATSTTSPSPGATTPGSAATRSPSAG